MVDHKITGAIGASPSVDGMEGGVQLTERGAELLRLLPGSITMDPAGIDLFHTILQIMFAHMYSPYRFAPGTDPTPKAVKENRMAALAFLQTGRSHDNTGMPRVTINVGDAPDFETQYTLIHRDRAVPLVLRIDPRQGTDRCITVQMPTGIFVGLDMGTIKVPKPPGKVV